MGEVSLTVIDVIVVIVLLVSAGFAMWRGLVSETFTIIDWVVAAFVALRATPIFLPLLRGVISPSWLEYGVVFLGTFFLMFIPLSMLNHRLSEAVQKSEIGPVDRAAGAVFGIGRGLVIIGLAYIAYASMVKPADRPDALTHARFFPLIRQSSEVLLSLAPGRPDLSPAEGRPALEPRAASAPPSRNDTDTADTKTYGANDRRALDRLIEGSSR
jgi:membrane protein required for colicin V production